MRCTTTLTLPLSMEPRKRTIVRGLLVLAAIGASTLTGQKATAVIYTIDPTDSVLQVFLYSSGTLLSDNQFGASAFTSLSGTLNATVGVGNITFTDTNNIIPANQADPIMPGPGGGVPSAGAPADGNPSPPGVPLPDNPGAGVGTFGMVFVVPNDRNHPLDLNNASQAGYVDINSMILTLNGTSSIAGGTFDLAPLNFDAFAGNLEYNLNYGTGDGRPFVNGTSSIAVSPAVGNVQNGSLIGNTLNVGINDVDMQVNIGPMTVDAIFIGHIVAHAVPEPSTFVLGALGIFGLGFAARWKMYRRA